MMNEGFVCKISDGFCQQSLHNLELIKLLGGVLLLLYVSLESTAVDGYFLKDTRLLYFSSFVFTGWFWQQTEMSSTTGRPKLQISGGPTMRFSAVSAFCTKSQLHVKKTRSLKEVLENIQ